MQCTKQFPVECVIFGSFNQQTDNWRWDFCFVIFRGAMSSVAGTFKLLSFITFLFVLQTKIHLDWPWKMSFPVQCVIFIWFKQKTDDWRWDLCFVILRGDDVKCPRYIQDFIVHNIFICASNQNSLGLTVENVIFCWMCNFHLYQAKKKNDWRWDLCFVIFRGAMSSVAGTFKL